MFNIHDRINFIASGNVEKSRDRNERSLLRLARKHMHFDGSGEVHHWMHDYYKAAKDYEKAAAIAHIRGDEQGRARAMLSASNSYEELGRDYMIQSEEYEGGIRYRYRLAAYKAFVKGAYMLHSIDSPNLDLIKERLIKRAEESIEGVPQNLENFFSKVKITRDQAKAMLFIMKMPRRSEENPQIER